MKEEKKAELFALLSDFGLEDSYVAEMKAVLLKKCPNARFIDISHQVKAFSIRQALFFLLKSYSYFPKETVFVAVVDPGVGSLRRALALRFKDYWFIGPDNGIFSAFFEGSKIYEANFEAFGKISSTFHGRDVFAPLAADITNSENLESVLSEISSKELVTVNFKAEENKKYFKGFLFCEDHFGNWITNLNNDYFEKIEYIQISAKKKLQIKQKITTFSDLEGKKLGFLKGSHGFIEIVANQKRVRECLKIKTDIELIELRGVRND